jgi:hypothetical protein
MTTSEIETATLQFVAQCLNQLLYRVPPDLINSFIKIANFSHLLTPWSRVLLEKLTSKLCSYSRNFPHLCNPKVPHRTHKRPPPVPILSQLHLVPTIPSNFLKIHLNIILPSTSWSPQWLLLPRLPHQHPVHNSILHHTRHMPCPSHGSRFCHPHNIG